MVGILWTIIIVLFILWIVGFAVNWGAWVWVLLAAAAVLLVLNLVTMATGRRWW